MLTGHQRCVGCRRNFEGWLYFLSAMFFKELLSKPVRYITRVVKGHAFERNNLRHRKSLVAFVNFLTCRNEFFYHGTSPFVELSCRNKIIAFCIYLYFVGNEGCTSKFRELTYYILMLWRACFLQFHWKI